MSRKTPPVAYITRILKTTGRAEIGAMLEDAPLTEQERAIITEYAQGMSYKEMAEKHNKSPARIYQLKRKAYESLHYYLTRKLL